MRASSGMLQVAVCPLASVLATLAGPGGLARATGATGIGTPAGGWSRAPRLRTGPTGRADPNPGGRPKGGLAAFSIKPARRSPACATAGRAARPDTGGDGPTTGARALRRS